MAALQFGVDLSTSAAPGADPVRDARRREELGFDFLTVSDHLHGAHPTYETWTVLTWAAAHTARIGLLTNVLSVPYRPPPVIAKMAESLDRLSGGRLTLGLGAGGNNGEAEAFGLAVRDPGAKIEALGESIEIIRRLWSEDYVTYSGAQFHTRGANIVPKPPRRIPIWAGVYGPRAVALAGRLADGWSPSLPYLPLPQAIEAGKILRRAEAEAGREPGSVVFNYNMAIRIGGKARDDRTVAGSVDEIIERLRSFIEAGFTSMSFWPIGDQDEQTERLAREILPVLRALSAPDAG
jgi:alkanesulfonate monooxygenase SsuD/methylene tetrahydromethanopterin reductase-like flavin-dependent oxidoreductase (luciferase family)